MFDDFLHQLVSGSLRPYASGPNAETETKKEGVSGGAESKPEPKRAKPDNSKGQNSNKQHIPIFVCQFCAHKGDLL